MNTRMRTEVSRWMLIIVSFVMILQSMNINAWAADDGDSGEDLYGVVSENATTLDKKDYDETIDNDDRNTAYIMLIEHMNSIKTLYDLNAETIARLDAVMYQANVYIANTDLTVGELKSYISRIEGDMDAVKGNASMVSTTSNFLFLTNATPEKTATYGSNVDLTLSLVNLGKEDVTNVVIAPNISTKASEWPFKITNASYVKSIASIPKARTTEEAYAIKQNVTWSFTVSDTAMTGTYPLSFHVQYYRNGNLEETDLQTYVDVKGKAGNGTLDSLSENTKTSTPRIIVTGFTTEPADVYAGDTFNLTITVKNTSSTTAVSNIQFDLKAAVEGSDNKTTYEAFLPTSGSATIYVPTIPAGESTDLCIEMNAKSDLVQKPYVVTVDAAYEDNDKNPYTASTNVSIPVKQEARVDTGDAEVLPNYIAVGEESNIVFDIYNMGKVVLYNVQVSFDDGSVAGGSAFLGKIEPGATGNVDVMVTGAAANDGQVTATISYEDDAGKVTSFEKVIDLTIDEAMEEYYDDMDMFDYEGMGMDMPKSGPAWWVIVIIVVAVAGAVTGGVIIVKKKKAKKAELLKQLEEDDEDTLI